jgi:two-component sensor histidine kinase
VLRAAAASANDEVKRALSGVAQLLHHHADVHHALRLPDNETLVEAADYLGKLCRSISRAKLDRLKINLVLAVHPLSLESNRCWRLGMIVNELITNAARHAFPGRRGEVRVEFFRAGRFVKCVIVDNGSAPALVRPGRGFRIIEELTTGLDGWLERKFGPAGSSSIVTFPYAHPMSEGSRSNNPPEASNSIGIQHRATMPGPDRGAKRHGSDR